MIIFLLIVAILILAHLDWQFWKTMTEPKLKHEAMEMQKIIDMYEQHRKQQPNYNKSADQD